MKSTLNWGSPFDEAQLAEESQPAIDTMYDFHNSIDIFFG